MSSSLRRFFLLAFISLFIFVSDMMAQRRPELRPPLREYFAGSVVLLPLDARPVSLTVPQMIGRIADHQILTPPASLFQADSPASDAQLMRWLVAQDYANAEGLVVVLTSVELLAVLREIHAAQPRLPILAALEFRTQASDERKAQLAQGAGEFLRAGILDFLIVNDAGLNAEARRNLPALPVAERVSDRLVIQSATGDAVSLLLARLLNQRFGLRPAVQPIYSSVMETAMASAGDWQPAVQVRAAGGLLLSGSTDNTRRADLMLFVHTPQTGEQEFTVFVESISQALNSGLRVALVETNAETSVQEKLLSELRRRKLFNSLYAYAAGGVKPVDALAAALSQATARLAAVRFLRDDLNRMQRMERAQIEMLLYRWLRDVVWESEVLPNLQRYLRDELRADPDKPAAVQEQAENFARVELRKQASAFFTEQFRNNVHELLLARGDRAEFRVRAIQRFLMRFPTASLREPDIRPGVYLFLENIAPATAPQSVWVLRNEENLDRTIFNRFFETQWNAFSCGTAAVELSVRVTPDAAGLTSREAYSITSRKKSRETRLIEIAAPSVQGTLSALSKLELLGQENRLLDDFQLVESPALSQRGIIEKFADAAWSHRDRLDMIRFLSRARMNRYYYAPLSDALCYQRWRETYSGLAQDRLRQLQRVAQENFVDLVYGLSPHLSAGESAESDRELLLAKLDSLYALGIRHFALLPDHSADAPLLPQAAVALDAQLIRAVHKHLTGKSSNVSLTILPASFANPTETQMYLRELRTAIPSDISLLQVDALPFFDAFRRETAALNEADGCVVAAKSAAHIAMLPLLTAADYAWNPREYDAAGSLARALQVLYDARSRTGVRAWAAAFREAEPRGNMFALLSGNSAEAINLPALKKTAMDLRAALEMITTSRERGLLRGELAQMLARIETALNEAERLSPTSK